MTTKFKPLTNEEKNLKAALALRIFHEFRIMIKEIDVKFNRVLVKIHPEDMKSLCTVIEGAGFPLPCLTKIVEKLSSLLNEDDSSFVYFKWNPANFRLEKIVEVRDACTTYSPYAKVNCSISAYSFIDPANQGKIEGIRFLINSLEKAV